MTKDEALKLALEALETGGWNKTTAAITAIKKALAQPEQILTSVDANTHQPEQEPVAIMREMLEVQGQHGNWNYDSYMHGLYNGMEYMVALAEKREPKFRDAPDDWLAKYEVKRDNFNSTEPLTEATHSIKA